MTVYHFGYTIRDRYSLNTEERWKGRDKIHKRISLWRYDHLSVAFCNEGSLYLSQRLTELSAIRSEKLADFLPTMQMSEFRHAE